MARYLVCLDPISPYPRFDKSTMCLCFVSLHLLSTGPVFSQKVSILPRYLFLSLSRSSLPPSPTQWKWSSDTRREASLALPSALLSVSHVLTPIARRRRRRRRPSEISRGERERERGLLKNSIKWLGERPILFYSISGAFFSQCRCKFSTHSMLFRHNLEWSMKPAILNGRHRVQLLEVESYTRHLQSPVSRLSFESASGPHHG